MTQKQELMWLGAVAMATVAVSIPGIGTLLFVPAMILVLIVYLKLLPKGNQ